MSTFHTSHDDYSVEEISYDDMMSILSVQGKESTDIQADSSENSQQEQAVQIAKETDVSRRISESANKQLPDWLLNH